MHPPFHLPQVLSGKGGTLAEAGVKPGAKLMLLAAAGSQTAGQAALQASRASRQEALEKGRQQLAERAAQRGAAVAAAATAPASMRQRAEAWQKTGIAALRDLQLSELPSELFGVAPGVRVLDAGGNRLSALPPGITQLTGLQRLRLSINLLGDEGMRWAALAGLTQLAVLAADDNQLAEVPPCVSGLARLQKLSLNGNQIGARAGASCGYGWLPRLAGWVDASTATCGMLFCQPTRPSPLLPLRTPQPACPRAWARCASCARWRCAATAWRRSQRGWAPAASWRSWTCGTTAWRRCPRPWDSCPPSSCCFWTTTGVLGRPAACTGGAAVQAGRPGLPLLQLVAVTARHRSSTPFLFLHPAPRCRLRSVPPAVLTGCSALATLSLHGNPLTAEELRETPGWAQFDERRRAKYDKQASAPRAVVAARRLAANTLVSAAGALLLLLLLLHTLWPSAGPQVDLKVLGTGFDEGADIWEWEHYNDG